MLCPEEKTIHNISDVEGPSERSWVETKVRRILATEDLGEETSRIDGKYRGPGAGINLVFYDEN